MKQIIKPEKILKKFFLRKQKANCEFSLRRFAKYLSVQPSYLSGVLSGKKPFPQARFSQFVKYLEMDDIAENQLRESILHNQNNIEILNKRNEDKLNHNLKLSYASSSEPISTDQYKILDKWYYLPILDFCTCNNFKGDISFIAQKFNILKSEAKEALIYLQENGFLKNDFDGKLIKSNLNIRFPNKGAHTSVINFHKGMTKKVFEDLNKVNNFNFEERFYNNITLAVDPSKLKEVKQILKEALLKASLVASQGDCSEVYLLNLAYIPLTSTLKD